MRKLFLPAWYLPNGAINAAENQLDAASSSCEWWGIWCGALVVIAVIAELVIAGVEPPYNTFLTASAIADAAVAIGIVGEVLFGMLNNRIQTDLRRRSNDKLSDAIDRAARLEKEAAEARERTAEIERVTAWRHVSPEQRAQIVDAIRGKASVLNVLIEHQRDNPEAWSYSMELKALFENADVAPSKTQTGPNSFTGVVFGLLGRAAPEIGRAFIRDTFEKAGIPIWLLEEEDAALVLSVDIRAFNLYIFVDSKPPPPKAAAIMSSTKRA